MIFGLPVKVPNAIQLIYPDLIWQIPSKDSIFLTFDDGPHPDITPWVLSVLKKYNAKATFFCIGDNIKKYPEIFEEILNQGHQVANHTFNHIKGWKTSNHNYFENINTCQILTKTNLFRPPYGQISFSQIKILKLDYKIIMWTLLAEDWKLNLNTKQKLHKMISKTKTGQIVVFHDSIKASKNLKELLPGYLDYLSLNQIKSEIII